jgi:hypothetical protein
MALAATVTNTATTRNFLDSSIANCRSLHGGWTYVRRCKITPAPPLAAEFGTRAGLPNRWTVRPCLLIVSS